MPIFIIFLVLCSMFFQLDATFDASKCTLQEWASECFKNYREYSEGGSFTEPKPILSFNDFQNILEEFNTKIKEAPYVIKVTNEKIFKYNQELISETTKIAPGQDTKIKGDLHHIKITTYKESFPDGSKFRSDPDTVIIDPYIEKIKIDPKSKICFVGDIHGSIHSLLRNLLRLVSLGYLKNDFSISENKKFYMVFTGDYVDRGRYSVEVIYTLLKLKLKNMEKMFLLKGNHETISIYSKYGFTKELLDKFSTKFKEILQSFDTFCQLLPLALFIGCGQDPTNNNNPFWIQCCHGGIEPTFKPNDLKTFLENNDFILNLKDKLYQDPVEPEAAKMVKDKFLLSLDINNGFTWCDFLETSEIERIYYTEDRIYNISGIGKTLNQYLDSYGIKAIFRGHQHSNYGLKIGGETHWKLFGGKPFSLGPLLTQAKQKESLGFKISEVSYPIFTFSTASEGVELPCDCFGILTTRNTWDEWSLLPYEFLLSKDLEWNAAPYKFESSAKARNGKFVRITSVNSNVENLKDPISFEFTQAANDNPVPEKLFEKLASEKPVPEKPAEKTTPEKQSPKAPSKETISGNIEPLHSPLKTKVQELKANLSQLNNKLSLLQQKLTHLRKKLPA